MPPCLDFSQIITSITSICGSFCTCVADVRYSATYKVQFLSCGVHVSFRPETKLVRYIWLPVLRAVSVGRIIDEQLVKLHADCAMQQELKLSLHGCGQERE